MGSLSWPNGDSEFGQWLRQSALDYGAARCCLLNGLFPGFVLAQQAVEKALKAYIRLKEPKWKRSKNDVGLIGVNPTHDLLIYAKKVDSLYPTLKLEASHSDILEKLSRWFEGKYPDGKSRVGSSSTSELEEVDKLLVPLLKNIPVDPGFRVRTGIYPALWGIAEVEDRGGVTFPEHIWLIRNNLTLEAHAKSMIDEIRSELGHNSR